MGTKSVLLRIKEAHEQRRQGSDSFIVRPVSPEEVETITAWINANGLNKIQADHNPARRSIHFYVGNCRDKFEKKIARCHDANAAATQENKAQLADRETQQIKWCRENKRKFEEIVSRIRFKHLGQHYWIVMQPLPAESSLAPESRLLETLTNALKDFPRDADSRMDVLHLVSGPGFNVLVIECPDPVLERMLATFALDKEKTNEKEHNVPDELSRRILAYCLSLLSIDRQGAERRQDATAIQCTSQDTFNNNRLRYYLSLAQIQWPDRAGKCEVRCRDVSHIKTLKSLLTRFPDPSGNRIKAEYDSDDLKITISNPGAVLSKLLNEALSAAIAPSIGHGR